MNTPIQAPMPRDEFQLWLEAKRAPLQISRKGGWTTTIITLSKTERVDYLFCADNCQGPSIRMNDTFHFCGLYFRQDKSLHLVSNGLCNIISGLSPEECMDSEGLRKSFRRQVNQRIEETISEDRQNLTVKRITDPQFQHRLTYYQNHSASEESIRLFFSDKEPDICFHGGYELNNWGEEGLLTYIQNPDAVIQTEAEQYIRSHQEEILLQFLENDALRAEYQALMEDAGNPLHRMKAITAAIKGANAKTVNVTVRKDGQELTFKAAADFLTGHRNYYSINNIPAQDRREFERLFGRHSDYKAEDITKITYGRNIIYEAPPTQAEGMEDEPAMQFGGM